jgi:hypothetical protein
MGMGKATTAAAAAEIGKLLKDRNILQVMHCML